MLLWLIALIGAERKHRWLGVTVGRHAGSRLMCGRPQVMRCTGGRWGRAVVRGGRYWWAWVAPVENRLRIEGGMSRWWQHG